MSPKIYIPILLASLWCLGVLGAPAHSAEQAPYFALPTATGKIDLNTLKGKVIYVDFWASWCPPCRKSFPWLNTMQQRYGRQGLAVVAINVDKSRDLANQFLKAIPAHFTIAYDPKGEVADSYQVQGMPSSFIIDRHGQIRSVHIGFRDQDASELEQTLQTVLVN